MSKKLNKFSNKFFLSSIAFSLFVCLTACRDSSRTAVEFMDHMMDSPAVKAQEEPMRVPPVGTLPRGYTPYPFEKEEGKLAGERLKNPLPQIKEVFVQGKKAYDIFCIVCHGQAGIGDGPIIPKFPRPPSLLSEKVRQWKDGQIYHIIVKGQNLMPSYAGQTSIKERWAIVHYLRALQRATKPTEEDIEALKKALEEGTYP